MENNNSNEQISETTKIINSAISRYGNRNVNNEINSHEIICSDGAEVIKLSYQTINSTAFAKGCIEMIPELQKKSTGFDSDIKD